MAIVALVPLLTIGWYAVRGRVLEMARERIGYTGDYPISAETPLMDEYLREDREDQKPG